MRKNIWRGRDLRSPRVFLAAALSVGLLTVVAACGGGGSGGSASRAQSPSAVDCSDPNLPMDVWTANCEGNAAPPANPQDSAPPEPPPPNTAFGTPQTIPTPESMADITVFQPKAVTYHNPDYDENCANPDTGCSKPGAVSFKGIAAKVQVVGNDGTTHIGQDFTFNYENPDGTLIDEGATNATYEEPKALSDQPGDLTTGQKTSGEVDFEGAAPGGKVIVTVNELQTQWAFSG